MRPALVLCLLLVDCGGSLGPCTARERTAIGAQYVAELEANCDRSQPLAHCDGYPDIQARYEQARKEWVECSKK